MPGLNDTRRRILYYVPGLEVGGTEKNVHDLAIGLPRDRFEPVVVWSCDWGPLGDNLLRAGVPVHYLPLHQPSRLPEVVAGIFKIHPDIFHSFSYQKDDQDVRAANCAGVRTILTLRGDLRFWDPAQAMKDWEPFRNDVTRRISVCSEAIAKVVRNVEGVSPPKIRVIHNGVDIPAPRPPGPSIREDLGIPPGDPVIGYVANYRREKGHETLLKAFRFLLAARPSARLVCCGGGDPAVKRRLEAIAADMIFDRRVFLLDLRLDAGRVYRGLDLYVHPSDTEGFSNALLEAMAHELPVIATRTGGNPEAIGDGETGLLVAPGDPVGLSAAMLTVLRNLQLAQKFAKAARDKAIEKFQFEHMLDGYTRLYEEELVQR